MGTELLSIIMLFPVAALIWSGSSLLLKKKDREFHGLVVTCGAIFIGAFGAHGALNGYFWQGITMGSLLFIPVHFFIWLGHSIYINYIKKCSDEKS